MVIAELVSYSNIADMFHIKMLYFIKIKIFNPDTSPVLTAAESRQQPAPLFWFVLQD